METGPPFESVILHVGSRIREIPVSDPMTVRKGAGRPKAMPEGLSGDQREHSYMIKRTFGLISFAIIAVGYTMILSALVVIFQRYYY